MSSIEQRFERYRAIFTWKTLEGLVPNANISSITKSTTGHLCIIAAPKGPSMRIRSLRQSSFQVTGPTIFNSLPPEVRNTTQCSIDRFKASLDAFLETIPDLPQVCNGPSPPPMDQLTASPSNSINDWVRYLNINVRRPVLLGVDTVD